MHSLFWWPIVLFRLFVLLNSICLFRCGNILRIDILSQRDSTSVPPSVSILRSSSRSKRLLFRCDAAREPSSILPLWRERWDPSYRAKFLDFHILIDTLLINSALSYLKSSLKLTDSVLQSTDIQSLKLLLLDFLVKLLLGKLQIILRSLQLKQLSVILVFHSVLLLLYFI